MARRISRAEVLQAIRSQNVISRSRLAELVPISRATVSGIVSELIQLGILEEVGRGASTGGRRPIKLRYRPESRVAVGVVLSQNRVDAALTDMDGSPLKYLDIPVEVDTPDGMLASMKEAAERILEGLPRDRVLAVGVGTPGVVDSKTGVIEISVSKGWLKGGIGVRSYLEAELGLPVHVANRSRVAALGECRVGVGRDASDLIYLFLGQGIVAGIVIGGRLHSGAGSSAGEIGHVSLDADGPLCDCGNRGCLEVYAAEAAILARARAVARRDMNGLLQRQVHGQLERLTMDDLVHCARKGDSTAVTVLTEVGTKVGAAVSILIDLFNPEMVVIGGPIGCNAGDFLLEPARREAQLRTLPRFLEGTHIVTGALGSKAGTIGAAVFAINHTPIDAIFEPQRVAAVNERRRSDRASDLATWYLQQGTGAGIEVGHRATRSHAEYS